MLRNCLGFTVTDGILPLVVQLAETEWNSHLYPVSFAKKFWLPWLAWENKSFLVSSATTCSITGTELTS